MNRRCTWNGVWFMTAFATLWMATTALADEPAAGVRKVPERKDIEQKYLWNLESTFKAVPDWEKEYAALEKQVGEVAALRGTLAKGPKELLAVLKLRDDTEARLERVAVYTHLLGDQDARVSQNQALDQRSETLGLKYGQAIAWLRPELTAVPWDTLEQWMAQNKELALYRHALEDLFRLKEHILPAREEELIEMAGKVFANPHRTYELFTTADLQFPTVKDDKGTDVELSDAAFYKFMRSPEREVRKAGYEGITGTYAKYRNTAASLLDGAVQMHIFNKKARGYKSCLEASLYANNIPVAVYENLVNTVHESLPLLHRYTTLRKNALKLADGVHDYDLYAPFVKEQKLEYKYEDAIKEIKAALQPLGAEYLEPMGKGFDSRWVDVFTTKGKKSGAYSSGTFLTQPYILLNYFGEYDDVSTLAHEMGHSMHSYFSRGTQPYVYSDYSIFCAEVASTFNEKLLQEHVLKKITDPQLKLYLLVEFLEGFRGTVFRQTMFSEFEQRIHDMGEKGVPITADALGQVYGELMRTYYGPDYTHDALTDNYWIRIPHFYYNFYVFKYATSYCASAAIARRIEEGQPGAVQAYLGFLKSGSSKYPIELLKDAGVDMTKPEPILDAMQFFKNLMDETEKLLAQVK